MSADIAFVPHSPGPSFAPVHRDQDDDDDPSFRRIVRYLPPLPAEQPSFDRRLIVLVFRDDDAPEVRAAIRSRVVRALGAGARGVWHSKDAFGAYFTDARKPAAIISALAALLGAESVRDAAIFRVVSARPLPRFVGVLQGAIEEATGPAHRPPSGPRR